MMARCEAVETFADMYPEFAPDPIEVRCDERARFLVIARTSEPWDPRSEETTHTWVCAKHGTQLITPGPYDSVLDVVEILTLKEER